MGFPCACRGTGFEDTPCHSTRWTDPRTPEVSETSRLLQGGPVCVEARWTDNRAHRVECASRAKLWEGAPVNSLDLSGDALLGTSWLSGKLVCCAALAPAAPSSSNCSFCQLPPCRLCTADDFVHKQLILTGEHRRDTGSAWCNVCQPQIACQACNASGHRRALLNMCLVRNSLFWHRRLDRNTKRCHMLCMRCILS